MTFLNLEGMWKARVNGETFDFILPGTSCENHIGEKAEYSQDFTKETLRTVLEKYEYVGPIELYKNVVIDTKYANKHIELFLERVNVASSLYIDGKLVDRQHLGLSTPHIYDVTSFLTPGKHEIKVIIDNRNLINIADMASGYSKDTAGFWNGILGKIGLRIYNQCHIVNADFYNRVDGSIDIKLTLHSDEHIPFQSKKVSLRIEINGETNIYEISLFTKKQTSRVTFVPKNSLELWDEFNPKLYKANVDLVHNSTLLDSESFIFGLRQLETRGNKLYLNQRQLSLRGTVECSQFPITGYPPMTKEIWLHNFTAVKEWGLNHVRFHAWCPPEAAFEVADELGLYLQVEMPLWLNKDVTSLEVGEDSIHENFYFTEARKIMDSYGNHPSFCLFSCGNENMGDFTLLEDIVSFCKAKDPRHLYTLSSNFDHPVSPVEDFFVSARAKGMGIRAQYMQEDVAKNTRLNFSEAIENMPLPVLNFEVGQYCVYPDVDIIESYTGNMLPVNFDIIKKQMLLKGVHDRRKEYIKASGNLVARLYKEDIEAVLRTKNMGGFQLLSLADYTGQMTATVGLLDVFYNEKGICNKDFFRQFSSPVVPLFKAKRIFENTESLKAELDLYDYGKYKIEKPEFHVSINSCGKTIWQMVTAKSELEIDLSIINSPQMLEVVVQVEEYKNSWTIFVFPQIEKSAVKMESFKIKKALSSKYVPVFWSPAWFETDEPCGAMIDENHEIFNYFPTGKYPDYQWKNLLDNAIAVDRSEIGQNVKTIVELVPNFKYNSQGLVLFETAEAIYSGFNFDIEDIPTRALKNAIMKYAKEKEKKVYNLKV